MRHPFKKTLGSVEKVRILRVSISLIFVLFAATSFAQDAGSGSAPWQTGVFIGRALPHGVSQNDNIFSIWGLRMSLPMGGDKSHGGYFDATYTNGIGGTVTWQGLSGGVSLQVPFETLILGMGIGLDVTRYTSDAQLDPKTVVGEYATGSLMTKITSSVLARFDMTFNSAPGTTMMFDLGLVFEF